MAQYLMHEFGTCNRIELVGESALHWHVTCVFRSRGSVNMDVYGRLIQLVTNATSPLQALQAVPRIIAEELRADACTVLATAVTEHGLELRARFGDTLASDGEAVAEKALSTMRLSASSSGTLVAVPVASLNCGVGVLAVERHSDAPFTTEEMMRLSGVAAQLVELLEGARIGEAMRGVAQDEQRADVEPLAVVLVAEKWVHGLAASPGIAIGRAAFRDALPRGTLLRGPPFRGQAVEAGRIRDALQMTRNDLLKLQAEAASEIGEEQALIFGAHLLLLNDPLLEELAGEGIAAGHTATVSVDDAFAEIVRRLQNVAIPYLQERIDDIEDVRSRVLGHLLGTSDASDLGARIVISTRTPPSLMIELKARGAVGIATELGGVTSHGVVLARALGVPAVTGVQNLLREASSGDTLIIDGETGVVVIRPTAATRSIYAKRIEKAERARTAFVRYRDQPARTADGVQFALRANIAFGADLVTARENRADGVGLYRTEFPFIVRDGVPTVDEQVRIYAKAYDAFPRSSVTFRLLDLAADKFLPTLGGIPRNAFHGYRSIRILFDHPHVLRDQVQAFAIAAAGRPLRILIPMVTSIDDVVRVKQLATDALRQTARTLSNIRVVWGVMVETPAAVELVPDLAREVDFFSIGTNDLIQYTLVVDREDPRLASEQHSYHPAILRMLRRVARDAHDAGRPVSVCGEMAVRPLLALTLLAMEIDSLSVSPRAIPELKRALAGMRLDALRARMDEILGLPTQGDVIAALRRHAPRETEAQETSVSA